MGRPRASAALLTTAGASPLLESGYNEDWSERTLVSGKSGISSELEMPLAGMESYAWPSAAVLRLGARELDHLDREFHEDRVTALRASLRGGRHLDMEPAADTRGSEHRERRRRGLSGRAQTAARAASQKWTRRARARSRGHEWIVHGPILRLRALARTPNIEWSEQAETRRPWTNVNRLTSHHADRVDLGLGLYCFRSGRCKTHQVNITLSKVPRYCLTTCVGQLITPPD
jgi:hypothetical protein